MAVTDKYNVFVGLMSGQHIIVITGLCQSPDALRTDIGGRMDTQGLEDMCGAVSDLSSDDIIHCFLHSNFPQTRTSVSGNIFTKALKGPTPFKTV